MSLRAFSSTETVEAGPSRLLLVDRDLRLRQREEVIAVVWFR